MRRRLILHETGFLTKSLSRPTLLTAEFSSGYLLYLYRIQQFVSELIEYACIKYTQIKGLDSREITSLPEIKNLMNMVHHFTHGQT